MAETVIILGAGASAHAGAPLMKTFLDVADDLRKRERTGIYVEDFQLVADGLNALQLGYAKAEIDLLNIESVFAAFEMAKLLNRLPPLSPDRVAKLPTAMKRVIATTLGEMVTFPDKDKRHMPNNPEWYDFFAELIQRIIGKDRTKARNKICIITFNYDLCIDYALHARRIPFDYCFKSDKVKQDTLSLIKLHGSLNWICCPKPGCGEVTAWRIDKFFNDIDNDKKYCQMLNDDRSNKKLNMLRYFSKFSHCDGHITDEPMIIPPTSNKVNYYHELQSLWITAAEHLSTAENIFVCGYSLPSTDHFFRSLYALGTMGDVRLKRLRVFDPDETVDERFRKMLSGIARDRFKFHTTKFENNRDNSPGAIATIFKLLR